MATNLDKEINVHDGCTLLPFTLIKIGAFGAFRLRFTISSLLSLEQTFNKSLWGIMNQALVGSLGEEEQTVILQHGLTSKMDVPTILNSSPRADVLNAYKQSQFELIRAIGYDIIYDEHGVPISIAPREARTYKRAEVRDTEAFSLKKPKLETFSQWYELALNTLFQSGVTIPITELLSLMPIELEAIFEAHDKRQIYLQQMSVLQAHQTAVFLSYPLAGEQVPDLEPILRRIDRQSSKETKSKFTREEAQAIIEQDNKDAEEAERLLANKRDKAKTVNA